MKLNYTFNGIRRGCISISLNFLSVGKTACQGGTFIRRGKSRGRMPRRTSSDSQLTRMETRDKAKGAKNLTNFLFYNAAVSKVTGRDIQNLVAGG